MTCGSRWRNKLALVFFAITLLAIGALYVYVAPGLQSRLLGAKLRELAAGGGGPLRRDPADGGQLDRPARASARSSSGPEAPRATGSPCCRSTEACGALQLSVEADPTNPAAGARLRFPVAYRAIATRRLITATESRPAGSIAEAAVPIATRAGWRR